MDQLYRQVGIDQAYRDAGHVFYTVESHVKHLREAKVGESLYCTTQLLHVDDKRLHVFHRLHRAADDGLVATAEQMHLHVNRAAAKAAPVSAPLRAKLEALLKAHQTLPLPPSVGRPVGSRANA
jgi:carnitine 3-dehydrogenase